MDHKCFLVLEVDSKLDKCIRLASFRRYLSHDDSFIMTEISLSPFTPLNRRQIFCLIKGTSIGIVSGALTFWRYKNFSTSGHVAVSAFSTCTLFSWTSATSAQRENFKLLHQHIDSSIARIKCRLFFSSSNELRRYDDFQANRLDKLAIQSSNRAINDEFGDVDVVHTSLRLDFMKWYRYENPYKLSQSLRSLKEAMLASNIPMDNIWYQKTIEIYCRKGKYSAAQTIYRDMKNLKLPEFSVSTTNSLLKLCQHLRAREFMKELLNDLRQHHGVFSTDTYAIMLFYHTSLKDYENTMLILDEMKTNGIKLDTQAYSALLDNDFPLSEKYWIEMNSLKIPKNIFTYTRRIAMLISRNEIQSAVALLNDMEVNGVKPNEDSYILLLQTFVERQQHNEVEDIVRKMIAKRCHLSWRSYSALISYFTEKGDMEKVGEICTLMDRHKIPLHINLINVLIEALRKTADYDGVLQLLQRMNLAQLKPDDNTKNALEKLLMDVSSLSLNDRLRKSFLKYGVVL